MGVVRYTVIDGEVVAEKRAGVRRQYVPDPLGSTVALLDNSQTKTDTFGYWPYGEEAAITGASGTPLRFVGMKGYYRDSVSRNYVRARYLNVVLGRWMTEDPIVFRGKDWNLLRYANSRPLTVYDASGLFGSDAICAFAEFLGLRLRKGERTQDFGGVICYNGYKYPCSWYRGPSYYINYCLLKHEKDHFDIVRCKDDDCIRREGSHYRRGENSDSEECHSHTVEARCLMDNCLKEPEGEVRRLCFERIGLTCVRAKYFCDRSGRQFDLTGSCRVLS